MVSRTQQHEHWSGAPHPACSSLTCAVCAVLCAVMCRGWSQPQPTLIELTRSVASSHSLPPAQMHRTWMLSHTLLCSCAAVPVHTCSCCLSAVPLFCLPDLEASTAQTWQQVQRLPQSAAPTPRRHTYSSHSSSSSLSAFHALRPQPTLAHSSERGAAHRHPHPPQRRQRRSIHCSTHPL